VAAVASDLDNVLVDGIATMVAAVVRLPGSPAITHGMFAFSFVRHYLPPCYYRFIQALRLSGSALQIPNL
jgi:hypothetical protein